MADRPRVVLYGHRLAARATGIARYVDELTMSLQNDPPDGLAYELGASPEPADAAPAASRLVVHRPPVPRVALHGCWTLFGRPTVDRWLGHPDLVHVLYPSTPVPTRAPLVVTIHDLMPILNPEWHGRRERIMFERAVRHAADHAAVIVANSEKTRREVIEHLGVPPERVVVVYLGTTRAFMTPADSESVAATCQRAGVEPGSYLLMLGSVSVRKDPETVLAALARSSEASRRRVPLVLAGPPGVGIERITASVDSLGLADRVVFAGWRPASEVRDLVAGALAMVHPSSDEGFGMTPLEAMASGVPAVVSSAGSLPEVCGDAALAVAPGDVDAWAAALDRIVVDQGLRADLIRLGRARAATFTWERTAAETAAVYRHVLAVD